MFIDFKCLILLCERMHYITNLALNSIRKNKEQSLRTQFTQSSIKF
jgi:hypothetical protein